MNFVPSVTGRSLRARQNFVENGELAGDIVVSLARERACFEAAEDASRHPLACDSRRRERFTRDAARQSLQASIHVGFARTSSRRGNRNPSRCSASSPCLSLMRYAAVPTGNPTAFSHSPRSTSTGTLAFSRVAPRATVADETT